MVGWRVPRRWKDYTGLVGGGMELDIRGDFTKVLMAELRL